MLTFNDKTMIYDNNGNMTSITNSCGTTTYIWDARNRLIGINGFNSDCSVLTASFKYDTFGRRIEKTINGKTTNYLYDGMDIVQEIENGTVTANYIRTLNIDEPLARIKFDGTVRYYQQDALGSVIALTDETGTIKTQYIYDPYGDVTISGEASDNPFQYAGRENDGTGLLYYRARYYSPELQRFISEDPIGLKGGINLYSYVGNSPVNYVDPWGLKEWIFITGGGGGGIGPIAGEGGTYFFIDPSTGKYYQWAYGSLGVGLGFGGAAQIEGGTFEGPDDPCQMSAFSFTVSGFASAGKGVSTQVTGTSFWGHGESGGSAGFAAGAGAGVAGMLTYSYYLGQGDVLPEKYRSIYQKIFNKMMK